MNNMMLDKKTIAIIGAAGRIGQEIVKGALEAGANVIAVDQSDEALNSLRANSGKSENIIYALGDITQAESILSVIEMANKKFGALDGAVNTAYPRNANYGRDFFDVTYEDFCGNLSLHLGGYFLFMQQCAKYAMEKNVNFSLVNMSSIYGVIAPRFDIYAGTKMTMPVEYAAIKSAIQHLTMYVTAYAKGSLFRVNCVSPGGILSGQNQVFIDQYNSHCCSKGMLDASDVVASIIFMLSDGARYITGQNIVVDDGFSS